MADSSSSSVRDLVDRLESTLHTTERDFAKSLQVTEGTSDADLDQLFLRDDFDRCLALKKLSVTNLCQETARQGKSPSAASASATDDQDSETQDIYLKQVEKSTARLREYLETLTNQIVRIVEKESDSFMDVASKLDGFRQILTDLKDSHTDFHSNFVSEKAKTQQVYGYLLEQHAMLQQMIQERSELATLVELQSLYDELSSRVDKLQSCNASVLQLEETCRMWKQIWTKSEQRDQIKQKLEVFHRQILSQLNNSFFSFFSQSSYFNQDNRAPPGGPSEDASEESSAFEDDCYFEEIEMSSYLRAFKELSAEDTLFQLLHGHILTKQIDQITKEAYQAKSQLSQSTSLTTEQLPLAVFTGAVLSRIVSGSIRNLIELTTSTEGENYVAGFAIIDDCLWPLLVRAVDTSLSFVTSTANLEQFQLNYKCCEAFVASESLASLTKGDELLDLFNLGTYSEFVAMQLSDKQVQKLEQAFPSEQQLADAAESNPDFTSDTANDESQKGQLCKLADFTIDLCLMPVKEEHYYLPRIGDKLIKLSIQMVIRHLNFITVRITERKLRTQHVLSILEDLHNIQVGINTKLVPVFEQRLLQVAALDGNSELTPEEVSDAYIAPLIEQLMKRFEHVQKPCRAAMASKPTSASK